MAPRPQWKGYLKLSFVSCPVALHPAIAPAERVSFRQINRQTGNRLRQQLVDTVTGEVVDAHDRGRGYQVGSNEFLMVEEEDLRAAQQEARSRPYTMASAPSLVADQNEEDEPPQRSSRSSRREESKRAREEAPSIVPPPAPVVIEDTRTIEVERFVPRDQIDPRYHLAPYYVTPRDPVGIEAYAVIRDAMKGKDMVGMGRVILSKRERPIIIEPDGAGIRGMTLRYNHEVRDKADYFDEIPPIELPQEMLELAEHILATKAADFDPSFLEDRYRTVLVEMLRLKQADEPRMSAAPSRDNVVNLMDALKRSLAAEGPRQVNVPKPTPRRAATATKTARAKKTSARSG